MSTSLSFLSSCRVQPQTRTDSYSKIQSIISPLKVISSNTLHQTWNCRYLAGVDRRVKQHHVFFPCKMNKSKTESISQLQLGYT